MKAKDKKDLRLKSIKELTKGVEEAKDAFVNLKLDQTQNKLKNTRKLFLVRKEISLMLTIIREKELAENSPAGGKKV
ncbi:MAG: 50S ribosomal protein L29 [Candidatus Levybacteria bacterium]|nr:50S ribosomal protein L29 [Candidatus Levybacteria bacterium]MDZ4227920.1 50S ribosomal protein L29 [Candidatus Levybacteria bacterium]